MPWRRTYQFRFPKCLSAVFVLQTPPSSPRQLVHQYWCHCYKLLCRLTPENLNSRSSSSDCGRSLSQSLNLEFQHLIQHQQTSRSEDKSHQTNEIKKDISTKTLSFEYHKECFISTATQSRHEINDQISQCRLKTVIRHHNADSKWWSHNTVQSQNNDQTSQCRLKTMITYHGADSKWWSYIMVQSQNSDYTS